MEDHSLTSAGDRASVLRTRYKELGNIDDLEEAISLGREVLALCPLDHPDYVKFLNNLAVDLTTRYEQLGEMDDVKEPILLCRKTLTLLSLDHPDRSTSLINLASVLNIRYRQLGKIEDLEEFISLTREALALCPPGHPNRSYSLVNLSLGLFLRYQQLAKMEDLEASIAINFDALTHFSPGHPECFMPLTNLAMMLTTRFQQLGKIENLEASISLNRQALALCLPGHHSRSIPLSNLAFGLYTRFQQLGTIDDLEESISLSHDALTLCPIGHPNHFMLLNNRAMNLTSRYQQMGRTEDLEESVSLHRDALALCPSGHLKRSTTLNNLANVLSTRYKQLGKVDDLEESIFLYREALSLHPAENHHGFLLMGDLSSALITRYKQSGKIEDLEEAISLSHDALTLCSPGQPDRSRFLFNLAASLQIRCDESGNLDDAQEMFSCYEQAATDTTSYLKCRLSAAIQWAETARNQQFHSSILRAYTIVLELLQRSIVSRLDVGGQHAFLAGTKKHMSLASDAASAAIQAGNLELAVEFLEQGRAMLWSRMHEYKYPLEQLRQVQGGGELADRLETLGSELERLVLLSERTATLDKEAAGLSLDSRMELHRLLSEEWETLAGKIRKKPGFAYFLQTPPFNNLQSAAAEGPVILINISEYRSDAIIITVNNPPDLVPLSPSKPVGLADQAERLTTNRGIISVLRYLWENIVSLVVARLDQLGVEKYSRIWWCPTGELCSLPLHAAGSYRLREKNLHDIYISSYTSTLSSLIRARLNLLPSQVPKLLVVGQHNETLRNVKEEVECIEQYVSTVNLLLGPRASRKIVLKHLRRHSWVHFACHGHLGDNNQPFHASFELHNGRRLTLLELIRARLPNAESAFLAACHTAAGDSCTPDENIHLSAALQFCGFRSVVGTLWEMFDEDGPMISKEFYKYMFRDSERVDFRDAAQALSFAVREMRKAGLPPERWVMFVHIGV